MTTGMRFYVFDDDYSNKIQQVKKDPYRYLLSKRDYNKTYNRFKRLLFSSGTVGLYLYYNIRYHQELGLVRGLKLGQVFYMQALPRSAVLLGLTYLMGYSMFVDFNKRKLAEIADIEVKKFDPEWFTYNEYRYALLNAPVYKDAESSYGRLHVRKYFYNYYQQAGWILRRRENNKDIVNDVPPKYDNTPVGPRANQDLEGMMNKNVSFVKV